MVTRNTGVATNVCASAVLLPSANHLPLKRCRHRHLQLQIPYSSIQPEIQRRRALACMHPLLSFSVTDKSSAIPSRAIPSNGSGTCNLPNPSFQPHAQRAWCTLGVGGKDGVAKTLTLWTANWTTATAHCPHISPFPPTHLPISPPGYIYIRKHQK